MANNRNEEEQQKKRDARRAARQTAEKKAARKVKSETYTEKYATDADRGLTSNRGTAARRDERAATWNSDGFDVNTYGKGHVSGQEMKRMRKDGMSSSEIESMTDGMHMTARATKQLERKKAKELSQIRIEDNPAPPATGIDTTTPGTPTPKIPPSLTNPEPGIAIPNNPGVPPGISPGPVPVPGPGTSEPPTTITNPQVIGGDTGDIGKKGDMTTTIGDGNTIIGSPIGNDYSVTIGNTGNMSGGGSGGSGLSNMMGAAAYSALNNNAYAMSQSQLNGTGRAATASANAELRTGATDRVANLYNMVGASQNYWGDKADAQQGLYLGDVWNQGGHKWTQAPNPESTEDKTSEILGDDDDD